MIFATRRGGSTLLAEFVSKNSRKVRMIDQPFDVFPKGDFISDFRIKKLPEKIKSQFFELSGEERIEVGRYIDELLNGGLKNYENGRYFSIYKNRTVLKIVNASYLGRWIYKEKCGKCIFLSRHPGAQVQSILRNTWGLTYDAYLSNRGWCDEYLTSRQLDLSVYIDKKGSYFEKCVLNWVYENLYFLKFASFDFLHVNYEDLLLDSAHVAHLLSIFLDDSYSGTEMSRASRSTKFSDKNTTEAIQTQDKSYLISKWSKCFSVEEKARGQEILDIFKITHYSFTSIYPSERSAFINNRKV